MTFSEFRGEYVRARMYPACPVRRDPIKPRSLSDYAEIYCAAGTAAQNRLNMRRIEPLCSLYSSNFDLTSPPARYELPNAHGFFPPRDMKHYHGVEKIMQARCLFHVKSDRLLG